MTSSKDLTVRAQKIVHELARDVALAEVAHQERTADINGQLKVDLLAAQAHAAQRMRTILDDHTAALEEVTGSTEKHVRAAGLWALPWKDRDPAGNLPSPRPPSVLRLGRMTLAGPYSELTLPALLRFTGGNNLILKAAGLAKAQTAQAVQNLLLRLLLDVPPGKLRLVLIDPIGLGQNLAQLIPHPNALRKSLLHGRSKAGIGLDQFVQQVAAGKVWTEPVDIEKRLAEISAHMEMVIQKYLRNLYSNMEE